jgi:hypothetical protein
MVKFEQIGICHFVKILVIEVFERDRQVASVTKTGRIYERSLCELYQDLGLFEIVEILKRKQNCKLLRSNEWYKVISRFQGITVGLQPPATAFLLVGPFLQFVFAFWIFHSAALQNLFGKIIKKKFQKRIDNRGGFFMKRIATVQTKHLTTI